MSAAPASRRRVALVVGSGGMKCAAAIGLLQVLRREGIEIDMAVGCSGGSIYASLVACGFALEELEPLNDRLWRNVFLRRSYRSLLAAVFPRFFSAERFGLVDDERVNEVLGPDLFGERTFADTQMPLYVVATDLATGQKVVISEGRIFDAVRASVAIPFLLPPWRVAGSLLVDGGASDPLPVDVAIREGADIIIAMGFEQPAVPELASFTTLALQTSSMTVNHLLRSTYAFYSMAHHAEIIAVMPQFDRRIGLTQVDELPYIIEQGAKAAEHEVPYLKRLLASEPAGSAAR